MSFGHDLLAAMESVLGSGRKTSGENYIFQCPVCKHRKPKLEIHIITHKWHCWVCDRGGTGLYSLLKWIHAPESTFSLFGVFSKDKPKVNSTIKKIQDKELPREYIPLWEENPDSWFWRSAFNYSLSRNIMYHDMLKYRIGYCVDGPYKNMIIIPSYDSDWKLNYFVGRSFLETRENSFKLPQYSKDIIGFESYVDFTEPIIIVESVINAITLKRNAIPLYGKSILPALRLRILEDRPERLYIWLDPDADNIAYQHVEFFVNSGISTYWVRGTNNMDVNDYGYETAMELIKSASEVTHLELLKYKINL